MIVPTVHLNGTSKDLLFHRYSHAYVALQHAHAVLKQTVPRDRDFETQGPDALAKANDEHAVRLGKVGEVMDEMQRMIEYIGQGRDGELP